MTALGKYIRLEAEGEWREAATTPPREVLLSFGKASLVISDFSENPLTHWALRAIERIDEVEGMVIFAASEDAQETLAVRDTEMIKAIEAISRDARTPGGRRRNLGRPVLFGALAVLVGSAVLWGPQLVREKTLRLIAPEQRELVSAQVLDRLPDSCGDPQGLVALERLSQTVWGPDAPKIHVLPMQNTPIARLPDGQVLMSDRLLSSNDASPDQTAGWMAVAFSLGQDHTGLARLISRKSGPDALKFLFSGVITEEELDLIADLTTNQSVVPAASELSAALKRLRDNNIAPDAFLESIPGNWPEASEPTTDAARTVLDDQDWVALQGICNN